MDAEDAKILLNHIGEEYDVLDGYGGKTKKYRIRHNKDKYGKYYDEKSDVYSEEIYQQILTLSKSQTKSDINLPNHHFIRPLFLGYENTRDRLTLNGIYPVDSTAEPLKNAVNVVINNESFQERISDAFEEVFGHRLIFTDYKRSAIELLVGDLDSKKK